MFVDLLRKEIRVSERLNGRAIFSWEGEDCLAFKIFRDRIQPASRFFVDIGAHHPIAMSNTYLFYKAGWRGINIDATPGSMEVFRRYRPEDVNLECAVGARRERATFSIFSDPTLNGFVDELTVSAHEARGVQRLRVVETEVLPINEVLETYARDRGVDLLNLDIEGKDLEVLQTWDYGRWRPKLIIVEILGVLCVSDLLTCEHTQVLAAAGYVPYSRLDFSAIFVDRGQLWAPVSWP